MITEIVKQTATGVREITSSEQTVIERLYNVPVGVSSGAEVFFGIAGEAVNQFRIIEKHTDGNLYKASSDNAEISGIVGLSIVGAVVGNQVNYTSFDEIKDSFFDTFQEGVVFLGLDGELTQTPPTTGWLLIVGSIVTPGTFKLAINIATAIERN